MLKSDFDFIPSGHKCTFNAGPQWRTITDPYVSTYDTGASCFMHKLIAREDAKVEWALFSAYFRGRPISGINVAKVRLFSFYYGQPGGQPHG